jgi:hypothetical protein
MRSAEIVGLIVFGAGDEGFGVDNVAVDPAHLYSRIGYVEYARRRHGDARIV